LLSLLFRFYSLKLSVPNYLVVRSTLIACYNRIISTMIDEPHQIVLSCRSCQGTLWLILNVENTISYLCISAGNLCCLWFTRAGVLHVKVCCTSLILVRLTSERERETTQWVGVFKGPCNITNIWLSKPIVNKKHLNQFSII